MRPLVLAGHYGRSVELDVCAPCHLVWFDQTETARLAGPGLLDLIGAMAQAQTLAHEVLRADARCPRCSGALKTVHNRSRWGTSLLLECTRQHGAYQSFAQFLQEKGLLRALTTADRARLMQRDGRIDCVNCGAAVGADDGLCAFCGSVPSLLDVARLARALDPEGAIASQTVHATAARQDALNCAACGAAQPVASALSCVQCGATLAVSRLAAAHECIAALGPALQEHARKPSAEVVKRRLAALEGDVPRRREWVAQVEAEARQAGHVESEWPVILGFELKPWHAVVTALVLGVLWWTWG
jgi:hypothetical protein